MDPERCRRAVEALKSAVRSFYWLYASCRAGRRGVLELERELAEARRRLRELEEENRRLRRMVEKLRAEASAARHLRELEDTVRSLRRELEEARRRERSLLEELERALTRARELEHLLYAGRPVHRDCARLLPPFVQALCEHGLLRLAKAWALLGDERILDYLDEDGYYALKLHRDVILAARCPEPEPQEPKPLKWVL